MKLIWLIMFMFIKCWLGAWGLNISHCAKFAIKKSRANCSHGAGLIPCHTKKKCLPQILGMPLIEVTSAVLELYIYILHTYLNILHRSLKQLWEWTVRSLPEASTHACADPWAGGYAREIMQTVLRLVLVLLTSVQTGNPDSCLIPDFHHWTSSALLIHL